MSNENKNIIGVSMPADEAEEIIISILESNSMIKITVSRPPAISFFYSIHDVFDKNGDSRLQSGSNVVITSITPIIPKYEIGDRVMVLATGEIGIVHELYQWKNRVGVVDVTVNLGGFTSDCFLNEICKLPAIQKPSE